ncbi:MAG: hypothetical protein KAI38_10575, partial [Candidatus Latescibacteria bacterium]|nr:hypothetical protein [Candidatus Latescibacterota bacterium]
LGGHCIPIDPFYLSWKARQLDMNTRFIELAGEINTHIPYYVVEKTTTALNERGLSVKGAHVLVLGVAYKPDIDDYRESPAFTIMELLEQAGAVVEYHDPYIPKLRKTRKYAFCKTSKPLTPEVLRRVHCAIIVTDHSNMDYDRVLQDVPVVVDTRNVLHDSTQEGIVKA